MDGYSVPENSKNLRGVGCVMFSKLVIAIKKVVSKLFGKESVQKALKVDVSVSDKMAKQIDLWAKLYQDKAP